MATPLYDKRQTARPAPAGRSRVLSPATALTAVVALLACALALQTGGRQPSTPRFLSALLGAQHGGALPPRPTWARPGARRAGPPPPRRTGPRSATAVRGGGYTVSAAGASVSLASSEAGTA